MRIVFEAVIPLYSYEHQNVVLPLHVLCRSYSIDAANFIYSWQHLSFILNQFTFFVSFKSLKVSELNLHEETKSMNFTSDSA